MSIPALSDAHLQDIAQMLKALSEVTRLKIMQVLHEGECCVGDVVDKVGTGQANISKHLQVLLNARLLTSRREGTTVYYRLAGPFVASLCDNICKGYAKSIHERYGAS